MSRSTDVARSTSGSEPGGTEPGRRPNLTGDLDSLLVSPPAFRRRSLGYDCLQVDNYVAWAESELQSCRRETEDVLERYGRCSAELEESRRLLAHSPGGQEMVHLTERIGAILQLAADEAAEVTDTARAEAERLRREAQADADAWRQEASAARDAAVAEADRLRREAEADRGLAADALEQAVADVAQGHRQAAAERARLDAESAEVRDRLAREAAELERRQEVARASLARLSEQLAQVLGEFASTLPESGLRLDVPQQAASQLTPG